jgi:hypothetical protein
MQETNQVLDAVTGTEIPTATVDTFTITSVSKVILRNDQGEPCKTLLNLYTDRPINDKSHVQVSMTHILRDSAILRPYAALIAKASAEELVFLFTNSKLEYSTREVEGYKDRDTTTTFREYNIVSISKDAQLLIDEYKKHILFSALKSRE